MLRPALFLQPEEEDGRERGQQRRRQLRESHQGGDADDVRGQRATAEVQEAEKSGRPTSHQQEAQKGLGVLRAGGRVAGGAQGDLGRGVAAHARVERHHGQGYGEGQVHVV